MKTAISLLFLSLFATLNGQVGLELPELTIKKFLKDQDATFKNVTVKKIEPHQIRIMHSDGAASVPFEKLPEDLRTKLGMTTEGAAKGASEAAIKEKEAAVLAEKASAEMASKEAGEKLLADKIKASVYVNGKVLESSNEALIINTLNSFTSGKLDLEFRLVKYPDAKKLAQGDFLEVSVVRTENVYRDRFGRSYREYEFVKDEKGTNLKNFMRQAEIISGK